MKVRPWLIVLLLLTIAGGLGAFGYWLGKDKKDARVAAQASASASVTKAREQRTTAPIDIAPAPLPTALPLVGPEGKDAAGAPLAYVDQPALRSLLWHRKFDELTKYVEELQRDFEGDPAKEAWMTQAGDAFHTADTSLDEKLDAWVAASPGSFAPYFARGSHRVGVGYARRGAKFVKDTPKADLDAMRATLDLAEKDLAKALELRPRAIDAVSRQIALYAAEGRDVEMDRAVALATKRCAPCLGVRVQYMFSIRPRWGGSYDLMRAFAKKADVVLSPKLGVLGGFVDYDLADIAFASHKDDEALASIETAIGHGEIGEFLVLRSRIRHARGDAAGATADAERALALWPGNAEAEAVLAERYGNEKRWVDAGPHVLHAIQIDPTSGEAKSDLPWIADGLVYAGWSADQAGKSEEALSIYDMAIQLAPMDRETHARYDVALLGKGKPNIPALFADAKAKPDDFRAHQRLDYALANEGRFQEIADMWAEYLSRHPDDEHAYLERAGTYRHLGRPKDSLADATKACDMGLNEACAIVRLISGQPGAK